MLTIESAALAGWGAAVVAMVFVVSAKKPAVWPAWTVPAVLTVLFGGYTLWVVAAEGPLGFWQNHVTNLWGLQVWWDLIIAIAVGFFLLQPRARAVGMNPWPWVPVMFCTGSIGLLAMLARMLFLESRQPR